MFEINVAQFHSNQSPTSLSCVDLGLVMFKLNLYLVLRLGNVTNSTTWALK